MDEQLNNLLAREETRSDESLNLIASENYPSREVGLAVTSIAGAKYAEGYPTKRYYAGCTTIDKIEQLTIDLACELFGVTYANVQPHSGSNANLAVYFGLLEPGDTILAPAMDSGGHLTHGAEASLSSQLWNFAHYHATSKEQTYEYDEIEKLALAHKPKLIIAGTSAYPRLLDWARFRKIADLCDALLLADIAHLAGLIGGGAIPSPFPYAHVATMTTQKSLRGPRGGLIVSSDKDLGKKIDRAVFPGLQGGPHMNSIAAKAQALAEAMTPEFQDYTQQVLVNAKALEDVLTNQECVLWTTTTETHLLNINTVESFQMCGKEAEQALERNGIIVNREILPGDTNALNPSGIRLGTLALTTRGMRQAQMSKIAQLIIEVLKDGKDVRADVANMCKLFPL